MDVFAVIVLSTCIASFLLVIVVLFFNAIILVRKVSRLSGIYQDTNVINVIL